METPPPLRSFGRIRSRTLKPRQASLMETLLPSLRPPTEGPVDPAGLMPGARETWMEVGFGGGEHMAAQAAAHPDVVILGAEPFLNGVASALRHIDEMGLRNVRIHDGDARELMARLPDACLDRLFVLFPDPWQKARHHKRRLVSPAFADEAARLLRPGGRLRLATDWADYADQMLRVLLAEPRFEWPAECAADWRAAPADHVPTRYEAKRLGDCAPVWLDFIRRPD
ncbi:tRNA (guanosine(46)-N7)-methyltransferase TrmB [Phenylobacterium sp.]|uniref:tRNA (guanosine(46)-N7)-methyltransferase TrmB n=1 Tax=Phenylobacterium sp. TaxID=1871053 RepID=UPI002600AB11|nr:tRNA (guanosine(46)-N7)-methyltransferase TrmB [Phenylobacterium sp.]